MMPTQEQVRQINKIMLQTIGNYVADYAGENSADENLTMYADDVAHNIFALQVFNENKDVKQFYHSIMQQDTLVREYFGPVFDFLEDEELLPFSTY